MQSQAARACVVDANILAMHVKKALGEVFNVGTGAQVSINEVAVLLKEQLSKTNLQDIHAPPRPPDVQHGYANLEKAKKLPGYNSSFSMKEGIKDLCKQYETRA